jgi:hypothetical protein
MNKENKISSLDLMVEDQIEIIVSLEIQVKINKKIKLSKKVQKLQMK